MEHLETEVCIVGAGYAGLTAGLRLKQVGRDALVLEARDRVGGRVYTEHLLDGTWLDFGGTWFGPGQDRAYALAEEMGVGTYPTWNEGDKTTCSSPTTASCTATRARSRKWTSSRSLTSDSPSGSWRSCRRKCRCKHTGRPSARGSGTPRRSVPGSTP